MKKNLFFMAAALAFCFSCSNDATVEENSVAKQPKEIAFKAIATPSTRAAVQTTTFPNQSMEVTAYQTDPNAENYFAKTTFSQDGSTGIWKGTTKRYWPLSAAKLNFFAVTGASVNVADITIDNALNKDALANVNYKKATGGGSDPTGTYNNATQSDIMYAFGRGYVKQTGNAFYFNRDDAGADVPVTMVFKHAMSLIKFQVKANDAASCAIQINNIKLNGASYTGALALTSDATITANTGDPTITPTWTPDAAEDNVTVPNITNYPLTQTYAPADGGAEGTWASLIVVPNATKGFDSFTVNYTYAGHTYDYTYTPSPVVPVAAGNVYTYQLNFRLHEITISPSVTLWNPVSPTELNIY